MNHFYKFLLGIFLVMISIFMMSFGISTYFDNVIYQWIGLAIGGAFLGLGIGTLININKKQKDCHECNGKKALIAVDTKEALEFIKENNLSVPE